MEDFFRKMIGTIISDVVEVSKRQSKQPVEKGKKGKDQFEKSVPKDTEGEYDSEEEEESEYGSETDEKEAQITRKK